MFIPLAKLAESAKFAWPVAAASCASEPHLAAKTPSITKNMCTWHIYCIYTFTLNLICFCGFAASEFVQMPACCFESWQNSKDATQSCQSPASASRKSLRRPLGNRNSFQTNAMQSKLKKMSSLCCILKLKNLYISMINQGKREQSISTNLSGDYPHQALPVKYMHMLEFPAFFGIQIETNVTEHNRSVTALVVNSCHQVGCEMNPIWECITKDHQVWDVRSEVYQNEISSVDTRCLLFSSWHFPVECSA